MATPTGVTVIAVLVNATVRVLVVCNDEALFGRRLLKLVLDARVDVNIAPDDPALLAGAVPVIVYPSHPLCHINIGEKPCTSGPTSLQYG
jgi:hypothetical protein